MLQIKEEVGMIRTLTRWRNSNDGTNDMQENVGLITIQRKGKEQVRHEYI